MLAHQGMGYCSVLRARARNTACWPLLSAFQVTYTRPPMPAVTFGRFADAAMSCAKREQYNGSEPTAHGLVDSATSQVRAVDLSTALHNAVIHNLPAFLKTSSVL